MVLKIQAQAGIVPRPLCPRHSGLTAAVSLATGPPQNAFCVARMQSPDLQWKVNRSFLLGLRNTHLKLEYFRKCLLGCVNRPGVLLAFQEHALWLYGYLFPGQHLPSQSGTHFHCNMSLLVSVCVYGCLRARMHTCYPTGWLGLHALTNVGWKGVIVQIASQPCVTK